MAMQLVIAKRGGFKKHPKILDTKVDDVIREIRKLAYADRASKMSVADAQEKQGYRYRVFTRVAGRSHGTPGD